MSINQKDPSGYDARTIEACAEIAKVQVTEDAGNESDGELTREFIRGWQKSAQFIEASIRSLTQDKEQSK